ncbi:MAG: peptidoglycan-associated lipoprotein, partial [Azoarcus sp.]|nr:peptidoglycan-associated lipoprotein [Azoarcus sp.]
QGASDAQIEAVSLGKEHPRCTEPTEPCYAENRRGDFVYLGRQ